MNANAHPTPPALLTRQQLADRWQVSQMTLFRREREGVLKPIRHGRIVRFDLAEIEAIEKALR